MEFVTREEFKTLNPAFQAALLQNYISWAQLQYQKADLQKEHVQLQAMCDEISKLTEIHNKTIESASKKAREILAQNGLLMTTIPSPGMKNAERFPATEAENYPR